MNIKNLVSPMSRSPPVSCWRLCSTGTSTRPHLTTTTIPVVKTNITPDQNDESLRKWKESLGIGSGNTSSDPNDPRKCIILSLGLEVDGRSDIIIDLSSRGALESLNKKPFSIKEGATFRMKARFKVQHQILSGMKYVQVVSRMGVKNKMQEMIVSSCCNYPVQ